MGAVGAAQTGTSRVRCFEKGLRGCWGMLEPHWSPSPFPGDTFWEGLDGFHAKTCRVVVGLDLTEVFITEKQPAKTWRSCQRLGESPPSQRSLALAQPWVTIQWGPHDQGGELGTSQLCFWQ